MEEHQQQKNTIIIERLFNRLERATNALKYRLLEMVSSINDLLSTKDSLLLGLIQLSLD